ncbi:MAG TPA: acyltransferase [Thermoanaerobaculia bacterium]|nr:acyltransferase [Thermoanaerobaculia bacterium]
MSLLWRLLDPLLLKVRSRLDHLGVHHPSQYAEELMRTRGRFDREAIVTGNARIQSVAPPEQLNIGPYSYIDGEIFMLTPSSVCTFGHHCFLGVDSRLWVQQRVTIGNFVLIAPRVDIFDNDSHPLDAALRRNDAIDQFERKQPMSYDRVAAAEVVIEDDVWIGTKSTITKGVHLGRGAVVAAGSVVTRDVEPFTLVGGNPAREIRKLA